MCSEKILLSPNGRLQEAFRANYDCIVGNVVAGAGWLGCDVDAVAAGVFSLEPRKRGANWDLECASQRQLQVIAERSPIEVTRHPGREMPGPQKAVVLVGDGRAMPWTPYFAQQSLQHSLLVVHGEDGYVAFDSYETDTEWGPARPGVVAVELWQDIAVDHTLELTLSSQESPKPLRTAFIGSSERLEQYLRAVDSGEQALSQLAVDTWLMARTRELNLRAFSGAIGDLPRLAKVSAVAWAEAAETVYMAERRERRGRAVPSSYRSLVRQSFEADLAVAAEWEEHDGE